MRRRLVRAVVATWLGWLVLANVFLQPSIGPRLIAWHPERFDIGWARAWTLVPGLTHVRGFWCGGHIRDTRWRIEIDRAVVLVNVPALVARTFHGLWPRASGIRVTVERTDTYVEPRRRDRAGFRTVLYAIRARDIGHLELAGVGIDGVESMSGSVDTRARGRLSIRDARLRIDGGHVATDSETLADDLTLTARVDMAPYVPTEHRDTGPFGFVTGLVELSGRLGDLSALRLFLRNTPMLDFEGGQAMVAGTVAVDAGKVVDPTDLTISEATYGVRYLDDVVATGTGRILAGRATETEGEVVRFDLETFELARPDAAGPYATGGNLSVRVLADRLDLVEVGDQFEIVVEIPSADILDIGAFDSFLPATSRMRLVGGTGELSSRIDLDLRTDSGTASLQLEADDVDARVDERDLVADLSVRGEFVVLDARSLRFDITTMALALDEVAVSGERRHRSTDATGGWWSHVRVGNGTVRLAKPVEIDAEVTLEAMDARPIFALLEDRSAALGWVDRLLDTEGLSGSARLVSSGSGIELHGLELTAGSSRVSGELCVRGKASTMVVLGAIGDRHIGLERTLDGTEWKVRDATGWFAERRHQFGCALSSGAGGSTR